MAVANQEREYHLGDSIRLSVWKLSVIWSHPEWRPIATIWVMMIDVLAKTKDFDSGLPYSLFRITTALRLVATHLSLLPELHQSSWVQKVTIIAMLICSIYLFLICCNTNWVDDMKATILLTALVGPFSILAVPTPFENTAGISARQSPTKPKPCQPISPAPTANETSARHEKFAHEFLVTKNITAAFEFINQGYIVSTLINKTPPCPPLSLESNSNLSQNHNPAAQNGFDSAWNILSPIWGNQQITVLRTKFVSPQGWLNYRSGFGEVVDRYRWEAGCIAEHVGYS